MANEKRAYKKVLEQMLDLIHSGVYPAGGRLPPERELAERFGVSRPTIREAIIALETLDYVNVKVGSGVYVIETSRMSSGTHDDVSAFELTETRALIEGEAAALAAKMITDEELAELKQSLTDMAMENETGDLAEGDADKKFHQLIAQATRNAMMESIINQMWHVRNHAPHVFQAYQAICEQDGARRVEEHQEIYDALVKRDAEAARKAMHHHFARILNKLISTMEEKQVQEVQRQTSKVRERFSLDHLVAGN
ncbi:MAG: FCD domain-containing protein [Xanthomonadales bacterium]|nr:FadR family transcriptional regulator [Xanthomonadales bacterium]NIS41856.1 FadR family transcriptional regulator [Desulfuromonadales bacterium]NIX11583.1 FCD domain-containing protein [Xanthomonadales bacterium]